MSTAVKSIDKIEIQQTDPTPRELRVVPSTGPVQWDITVAAEMSAHFLVVTDFEASEGSSDVTINVNLGKGATVTLATYSKNAQLGARKESYVVTLAQDAKFQGALLTTQCKTSHLSAQADFRGEDANCEFSGLTIVSDDTVAETDTVMNHHLPENTSRQLFKNILNGKAQATYTGLVFVEQHAQKSDSEQSNQNILLSDHARSIAQPQLKIHADDVIAAHGSTTGQLEEEALFYLQSRGFSLAEARRTLLFGFADELLAHLTHPDMKATLETEIHQALEQVLAHDNG